MFSVTPGSSKTREWRQRIQDNKRRAVELFGGKCQDCGLVTEFLAVYEFDHVRGEKKANLGHLLTTRRFESRGIQNELSKCDLVCANCHRIRTAKRS